MYITSFQIANLEDAKLNLDLNQPSPDRSSVQSHTSQYSSQVSLTHGGYVLDSDHSSWPNEFFVKRYNIAYSYLVLKNN